MPVRIGQIKFDRNGYIAALDIACKELFKGAIRAFLEAAQPRIPVDTGMARGSLMPLASFAGGFEVSIPGARARKGKSPRDANTGADMVTVTINSFTWPKYSLTFRDPVPQIGIHDDKVWGAFRAGRAAFKAYLDENTKKLIPGVRNFVSISYTTTY